MNAYVYSFPKEISRLNIFTYSLTVLVGLFFIMVSIKNLKNDEHMLAEFKRWNYSESFRKTVALWQLSCGILICIFPLSYIPAVLLIVLMLGAVYTHLKHDPPASALGAVVFLCMLSYIFWQLKPDAVNNF